MVLDNLRLASWRARGWINLATRTRSRDYCRGINEAAVLGLIDGISRFDPTYGVELGTYVVYWIDQKIRCHLQERHPFGASASRARFRVKLLSLDIPDEVGMLAREDVGFEEADDGDSVEYLLRPIADPRVRDMVQAVVVDEETYRSVGERHGISHARVEQLVRRELGNLRTRLLAKQVDRERRKL